VRPYLHPTVSRLRAHPSRPPATPTLGTPRSEASFVRPSLSPALSHFSVLSAGSSFVDLPKISPAHADARAPVVSGEREVFKWARLRNIEGAIFPGAETERVTARADVEFGTPTVLAANKFICIGTDAGRVLVFDFKQSLRCTCGTDALGTLFHCLADKVS
jgi:hypothetical protein